MFAMELFEKGGTMMFVLALLSVYAIGVVIYKLWQFKRANVYARSFVEPTLNEIKRGDRKQAMELLETTQGPLARIMRTSFNCVTNRDMTPKSREAEIMRVGSADLHYLEGHLRGLEMAAAVAPLLGLLGTVIGLIDSFSRLGAAGTRVDPSLLAGGIWEALLTTATGLAIAIPAMAAHHVLDGIVERLRAAMKDVSVQILALEDEFRKNERLRAVEEAKRIEQERKEAEIKRIADAQKAAEKVQVEQKEKAKTAPKESSTLKLLSPSY